MKQLKYINILTGVLFSLLLLSCSDNLDSGTGEPENPNNTERDVNLTVSIKLPGAEAVPYSQIALDDELVIDTVTAYAFVEKNGKFIYDKYYTFSKQKDGSGSVNGEMIIAGTKITLPMTVKYTNADIKFFFVANGEYLSSLKGLAKGEDDEQDFLDALTNNSFQGIKSKNNEDVSPLMMTTDSIRVKKEDLQNDTYSIEGLEFKRVSARIDIRNRERTLAIDSVQLINTPRQSLVFNKEQQPGDTWDFADAVTRGDLPAVKIEDTRRYPPKQEGSPTADMDSVHLKSLFFPYEGNIAGPAGNTSILIWGRLNPQPSQPTSGTQVRYTLNLAEGRKPGDITPVQLIRNNRYILLIENALAKEITYNFTVSDWVNNTDTTNHTMDPEITLNYNGTGLSRLTVDNTGNAFTIDVKSPTAWSVKVNYIDGDGEEWLTPGTPQSYSSIPDHFTLEIAKNQGIRERKAIVSVLSNVDVTAEESSFIVTQSANPLAKFAHQNLGMEGNMLNSNDKLDATTAKTAYGAWFQWGRPRAFENNTSTVGTSGPLNYTTMANWTNSTFYTGVAAEGADADTWTNFVNASSGNGTLNTDPCPSGYHVPTVDEWLAVIPYDGNAGAYATTNTNNGKSETKERTDNQITIETGPSSYKGVGDGDGYRTVFGVKTIDGQKYAYRWRYYAASLSNPKDAYLEIGCMPVLSTDATGTATTVAAYTAGDWSEANGVETRFFPAAGDRHFQTGAPGSRGSVGHYWSSSSYNATYGWFLRFDAFYASLYSYGRPNGFSVRCVAQ